MAAKKLDTVIVGSGVTGLTAAALLSKHGQKVALVEQNTQFGGAIRQFKRKMIPYDIGLHYTGCLGEGEILRRLWEYCDVYKHIRTISLIENGYDHFSFDDTNEVIRGYYQYQRFIDELHSHFPDEKEGIEHYFSAIREVCREMPFYNTDLPLDAYMLGGRLRAKSTALGPFLDSIISSSKLKAVLSALAFLYGVPSSDLGLESHALVVHSYHNGAYAVDGGGQSVVDAFLAKLETSGVQLLNKSCVEEILLNNKKVTGVLLQDGERLECEQVIFTGHPARILDMVPDESFRPAYRSRLKGLKNTQSMNAVYGVCEKPVDTLSGAKNYFLLPGHGEAIPNLSQKGADCRCVPMMMTNMGGPQSLRPGENSIILLGLAGWDDVRRFERSSPGSRGEEYQRYKQQLAADLIERAERRWGHICGKIEALAVATPLTFRDELSAPQGCTYGVMHCVNQLNPEVRSRLDGLYLAGQSIIMTGVVGASLSGFIAAGEILGLEALWKELRT